MWSNRLPTLPLHPTLKLHTFVTCGPFLSLTLSQDDTLVVTLISSLSSQTSAAIVCPDIPDDDTQPLAVTVFPGVCLSQQITY